MGRELRLPPELENFISRQGPLTMIIRGPPGSGKTTLSLAILEAFYGRKMFITGRRSKPGVLEDFPWLGSVEGHEIEVVDAVTEIEGNPSPAPVPTSGGTTADDAVQANVLSSLPPAFRRAWGRRGSGRDDLGRELSQLPPGMRRALAHSASDQRVMLVVDSWDAFVEECIDLLPSGIGGQLHRDELERMALRLIARGTAHLVLVLERPQASQLDYLVDGILTTSHETVETHPERWVSMPKLRGIRIENESYPYTLEGGKFKCIAPEPATFDHFEVFSEPDPEPTSDSIWPGSATFADVFGRLHLGTVTTLETDDQVTESIVETLLFPVISSVLKGGGRVLYIPAPSQRLREFWSAFSDTFSITQMHEQLRLVAPGATLPEGHPLLPCLVKVPRIPAESSVAPTLKQLPKAAEFITTRSETESPRNLAIVATDGLRLVADYSGSAYTPEGLPVMIRSLAASAVPHLIVVARTADPLLSGVKMLATLHLHLRSRDGRTFAHGLKPLTPAYSLTPRHPLEERAYNLLRIV